MNPKIKDLMIESGMIAKSNLKNVVWTTNMSVTTAEKFATLIINECINVIKDSDAECRDEWDYAERDLIGLIQKHFGVEE